MNYATITGGVTSEDAIMGTGIEIASGNVMVKDVGTAARMEIKIVSEFATVTDSVSGTETVVAIETIVRIETMTVIARVAGGGKETTRSDLSLFGPAQALT